MYRAIIICGDEGTRRKARGYLSELGLVSDIEEFDQAPHEMEFRRLLRLKPPHLVLLAISSLESAQPLFKSIEESAPDAQVIALNSLADQRTIRQLMLMGAKGFLPIPLSRPVFMAEIRCLLQQAQDSGTPSARIPQLYSFLPGKGGSGTSTLACHFGAALARDLGIEIQKGKVDRILLLDLDSSSGLSRYLFDVKDAYTLSALVESGVTLDGDYWPRFVTRSDALDVILAGRPGLRHPLTPQHFRPLLEHARENYSVICADLSGNWESYAVEVLRQSAGIFLVCCTDLGSVRLAQERMRLLEEFDLAKRVGILVNRFPDRLSISNTRIQDEIGAPVVGEFEFHDRKVQEALSSAKLVPPESSTGRQIRKAAFELCWLPQVELQRAKSNGATVASSVR